MSALQKSILKSKLPPKMPRSTAEKLAPFGVARRKDYTPVSWKVYFEKYMDVETEGGTFRVYLSPEPDHPERPRIITLHGGGYSGLSWSLFTQEITSMIHCQVISMDIRGHGETHAKDPDDLSGDTLANDVQEVLEKVFGEEMPPLVMIGHSMGGAVAVRVAHLPRMEPFIFGLAVIDVVEGTAMEALASMQSLLRGRPTHFRSIEHAIEWCVRSRQVRNVESARVSMPSQIVNCKTGLLATSEVCDGGDAPSTPAPAPLPAPLHVPISAADSIAEEEEDVEGEGEEEGGEQCLQSPQSPPPHTFTPPASLADNKYRWRIELSLTERHWAGWFSGLSSAFLNARAPRLLLLASIDGLDRDLTVGQMQGKFQLQVLPRCGHAVHEDSPHEVARVLATYLLRHRLTAVTERGDLLHLVSQPAC